jgi:hypothetical protein
LKAIEKLNKMVFVPFVKRISLQCSAKKGLCLMNTKMNTKWIALVAMFAVMGCAHAKKSATPAPAATDQAALSAKTQASSKVETTGASADAEMQKISCAKDGESRVLEVVKKGDGCALDYTKAGKESAVATSAHGVKHCVDAEKKIRAKLEHSGYSCS